MLTPAALRCPQPLPLSLVLPTRASSSSSVESDPLSSANSAGTRLKRIRTPDTTAAVEDWIPVLRAGPEAGSRTTVDPHAPGAVTFGAPLARVPTRNEPWASKWEATKGSTKAVALQASGSLDGALYEDDFVRLTSYQLVVKHLLCRRTITFDLAEISRVRRFCSEAQLVRFDALQASATGDRDRERIRPPGVSSGGLGSTGILWARDKARIMAERWRQQVVVVDTRGFCGKVGFSVDRPDEWWKAYAALERKK